MWQAEIFQVGEVFTLAIVTLSVALLFIAPRGRAARWSCFESVGEGRTERRNVLR